MSSIPDTVNTKRVRKIVRKPQGLQKRTKLGDRNNPVTQKARGVVALSNGYGGIFTRIPLQNIYLMPYSLPSESVLAKGMFARPCPETPRHGFVESRPVKSLAEAMELYLEARSQCQNAEVLLMPQCTGKFSGIMTNAGITFGLSNDGVTGAGKGVVHIPAGGTNDSQAWNKAVIAMCNLEHTGVTSSARFAALGLTDTAYVELVENDGTLCAVQVRNGPKQPTTCDHVPAGFGDVQHVLTFTNEPDLLAWEKQIHALKGKPGHVLYMPGGALSSHYAVHAIANGLAVVTQGACPEVGKPLAAPQTAGLSERDLVLLREYVIGWQGRQWQAYGSGAVGTEDTLDWPNIVNMACAVTHVGAAWGPEPGLLRLRAMAATVLARAGFAACLGELRHLKNLGPSAKSNVDWHRMGVCGPDDMGTMETGGAKPVFWNTCARHTIFTGALPVTNLAFMRETLGHAQAAFKLPGWGSSYDPKRGAKSCSFGGANWARCSKVTRLLCEALEAFIAAPTAEHWTRVVETQNAVVHVAHNGGKLLNKFTGILDHIALSPRNYLCNALTARVALGALKAHWAADARDAWDAHYVPQRSEAHALWRELV